MTKRATLLGSGSVTAVVGGAATLTDPALYLPKAGNLSELVDIAAARTNLGLGTLAVENTPLGVSKGGTGIMAGTSGGVLGFTGAGTLASSALLVAGAIMLGGGIGATPSTPLGLGTSSQVLHGNAGGAPTWGAVQLTADVTGRLPLANVGGVGSAGQILRSNGTDYTATTATYPDTGTANRIPFWSATDVLSAGSSTGPTWNAETLGIARGTSSSTGNLVNLDRTTTDITSGTKATLRNIARVNPASNPGSGTSYAAFHNTALVAAANSVNLTSPLIGSFYEVVFSGTGTLGILDGLRLTATQSAGAGTISTLRSAEASTTIGATVTTAHGFNADIAIGAAGALTTYNAFRANAPSITAGGAITTARGFTAENQGATGVTSAVGAAIAGQSGASAGNVNLLLGTTTVPAVTASIYNSSANNNVHAGNSSFGGTTTPTAKVHLAAGTIFANTQPLKFTHQASGPTSAEPGTLRFTTDKLVLGITSGPAEKEITLNDAALTSGRFPGVTTNGRLTDYANCTLDGTTLTVPKLSLNGGTGSQATIKQAANTFANGYRTIRSDNTNHFDIYIGGDDKLYFQYNSTGGTYATVDSTGGLSAPTFTPVTQQTYTIANVTTDRSYDANATSIDEVADCLGTLIADLRTIGLVL